MGFPGESGEYRKARDELLDAEKELTRQTWQVAELRRKLPLGGAVKEDYLFDAGDRQVRLSDLFAPGKDSLALYSYMFGPKMDAPCPMCTSMLDSLDGAAPHAEQRINLWVVARSPIGRVLEFARERGWRNLRLLSSAANGYHRDYQGEDDAGEQLPMMNVFVRRDGRIHHFWSSEMLFAPPVEGVDSCHIDAIWPLWHLLDMTAAGRGNFYPKLDY